MDKRKRMEKLSVIIPSYRNPKCLDICLESALRGQRFDNQIICVLDGFPEESKDIVKKYRNDVNFLPLPDNKGMQYALNVGVWNADNERILIVNDDNVFPISWDYYLNEDYRENLIITPNQIEKEPSMFGFVVDDFGTPETFDLENFFVEEQNHREDKLTPDGGIFPLLISKKKYMMVGGFDIVYDSPFYCDWDFFIKCELAGMETLRSRKINFYHFGSVATKNGNESEKFKLSETLAKDLYEYKWGFKATRNRDTNSHTPKNEEIKGIKYE